jgi:hypothetical protein
MASSTAFMVSALSGIVSLFFVMGSSVVLIGVTASNVTAHVFAPRRPFKTARLSDFLPGLLLAVYGQVHGFGRVGVAGCFLIAHAHSVRFEFPNVFNNSQGVLP